MWPNLRISGSVGDKTRRHQGQAMVEMALVAMLLLILTFGIADMGIWMYRYIQASNCVREAARRAVIRADNATNPPYCVDAGLQPTLPAGYKALPAGSEVTATVDTVHNWIVIGYLIPPLGPTGQIKATTSMRMEGQRIT